MTIFLETERLIIKNPTADDFAVIHELCTDKDVMQFIGDGSLSTPESTLSKLAKDIAHFSKHKFGLGLVYEKESGQFIGQAGLFHLEYNDNQPRIEIGYRLHKAYWNKGYATELTKKLVEWGFQNLPTDRLNAVVDPRNLKSQEVVKKAGLEFIEETRFYNKQINLYEVKR